MGFLKKFFSHDPEKTEQKSDAFLKASDCDFRDIHK